MDVKLPDGKIIRGVPDGTTKAQLAEKLQANGMTVPKEWLGTTQTPQPIGAFPQVVSGLAEGVANIAGTPVDLANHLANLVTAAYGMGRQLYGRAKGETPSEAASHAPDTEAAVNVPGSSDWLKAKMQQMGLTAQAPTTGGERLARGGAEFATGFIPVPGSKPGGPFMQKILPQKQQEIRELQSLAEKHNVPITFGELTNSRHAKNTEMALEQFPIVGLQSFRERQQNAVKKAATSLVERFNRNFENPGEEIQSSLQRVLTRNKKIAGKFYDVVDKEVSRPGVINQIPVNNTKMAVSELLTTHPDIFDRLPDQALKRKLQAIGGSLADEKVSSVPAGKIISTEGKPLISSIPATTKPINLTFQESRFLRKQLGNYIDRASKSAGAVGSDEFRQLNIIKSSLDNDINLWGESEFGGLNSKTVNAYRRANKFYQENVAPFRDTLVDKVTGKQFDTDTMLKTIIKPDRPKLAQKVISQLDPRGKQAVKYGILEDALNTSVDERTGIFSPQKFSSKLSKLGETAGVVFNQEEQKNIGGFNKLMASVNRAGQYMESPPTGYRVLQTGGLMGTGYMAATHPLATAGAAGTAKGLSMLLTTKAGKKMLLDASKGIRPSALESSPFLPIALQHVLSNE